MRVVHRLVQQHLLRKGRTPAKGGRIVGVSLVLAGLLTFATMVLPHESQTERVAGVPIEVRTSQHMVIMPGGQTYRYGCSTRRRRSCLADARWKALPRWPQPAHVELQVQGRSIRGLTMDGAVIVDPAEEARSDRRVFAILAGLLTLGGGLTLWAWRPSAVRAGELKLDDYIDRSRVRRGPLNETSAPRDP